MSEILSTQELTKVYGNNRALDGLSISVYQGQVYGILGPNGSGKTTTLAMLLDVLNPTSGTYRWFGEESSHHIRKRIGALLETPNFYSYLSAEQNLKISADIKEVDYEDITRVLEIVNLLDRKDDKFKTYSLGMKQRLAIASALMGTPEILLLDEPTNGLDPKGIVEIRDIIKKVSKEGITVILASHMLDEIEKVCTHVAILKKGKLLTEGAVSDILVDENLVEIAADDMNALNEALQTISIIASFKPQSDQFVVKLKEDYSSKDLNRELVERKVVVTKLIEKKKDLETQFLEITD